MKRCPKCNNIYQNDKEICQRDRTVLVFGPDPNVYGHFAQFVEGMEVESDRRKLLGISIVGMLLLVVSTLGLVGGLIVIL